MNDAGRPLVATLNNPQNRCFGCGPANADGLRLEFMQAHDGSVVCVARVEETFAGQHGFVHGGIIATLLDEAMAKAARVLGAPAMTRHMEVDFLRPVPCGVELRIEGCVVRSEGRKHWTEGKVLSEEGSVLAQGKGLFVEVRRSAGR
jgi:uncharacterized protein (TIGR00369 family)